jgi:Tfp pilus assembly protein PilV
MKKEKGSIMILTMVAVLILSVMLTGLLTVGTTEIFTTGNYHLKKVAYYTAVQGVEEIRQAIASAPNAGSVTSITKSTYETEQYETGGVKRSYMTGTLKDREAGGSYGIGVPITSLQGDLNAPKGRGISIDVGRTKIEFMIWKVLITADVIAGQKGKRIAFSEIIAGVYSTTESSY